ncbi:MAG: 3'(2'),5'-bisphosphate nucleotidase CysQ [Lachnospiraceae bacterium]|nr:3'(2'),5'-bisphosphate nucleotidase CysQ [Lachnospiraceae bacterium]HCJ07610.1 3'(2'),5'-bisphosphate nucleotidase [Lachnospiraceae bacterium]
MNQTKVLEVMKRLAVEAGKVIMEIYQTDFEVDYKEDESPLTQADRQANAVIVEGLAKAFPEYAILSEEVKDDKARRQNPYCFIVDPLDGTKEFVKRNGQFTVNIALTYEQHPVVGVIYVPVTRDLYYASTESGAYKTSGETGQTRKLEVSDKRTDLIWVGSKSHSSEKETNLIEAHKEVIGKTISAGSSLKGCMVAEGKADIYYRFGLTCEWDTAAMQCIAEQAGAVFRQMDGSEMLYNRDNTLNEKGFFIVNRTENIWV